MSKDTTSWTSSACRQDKLEVGEFCPRQPYLEVKIPTDAGSVQSLTIVTVSHDQGFSDNAKAFGGTYTGSSSFFDVAVITDSYHPRTLPFTFQHNVHASLEQKRHENSWHAGQPNAKWLSKIRGGDIAQIIPRADFMLWVNYVYSVELTIAGFVATNAQEAAVSEVELRSWMYAPLDSSERQTRLLTVYPGFIDAPLACSIEAISLIDNQHPQYEALSYCWGDPDAKHAITVRHQDEEIVLPINSSLYQALIHLRMPDNARKLWVDALCINQVDLDERARQVNQMPYIYSQAQRVLVWLGTSSAVRSRCFGTLKDIQNRLGEHYDDSSMKENSQNAAMSNLLEKARKAVTEAAHVSLAHFLREWAKCDFDWFRRTWVLQEVTNAHKAIVCCGHDSFSWSIFAPLVRLSGELKQGDVSLQVGFMPRVFIDLTDSLVSSSDQVLQAMKSRQQGILDVIINCHSLKATDPRDKIFALLQFGDETRDVANLPLEIRPNYQKTCSEVFCDFVRWWIKTHKSLRILSAAHTLRGRSWQQMYSGPMLDLSTLPYPTWCLDLEHGGDASWAKATLGLSGDQHYKASGDTTPDIDLLSSADHEQPPGVLRVRGHRVDCIERIVRYPFWSDHERQPKELQDAFSRIFDPTASMRAWLLDRDDQEVLEPSQERNQAHVERHYVYHRRGFNPHSKSIIPCYSPCLFVTRDQRVGLCPHYAKPEDIVVVLYGGPVPYLLREKEQTEAADEVHDAQEGRAAYRFVGECLLEGYMDGKAIREAEDGGLLPEIFNLV